MNETPNKTDTPRTDAFLDYFRKNVGRVADFKDWPTFARELERSLSEEQKRLKRARDALQWIVTDAVYKPPECFEDRTVTERWPEVARLALIDTEAPK